MSELVSAIKAPDADTVGGGTALLDTNPLDSDPGTAINVTQVAITELLEAKGNSLVWDEEFLCGPPQDFDNSDRDDWPVSYDAETDTWTYLRDDLKNPAPDYNPRNLFIEQNQREEFYLTAPEPTDDDKSSSSGSQILSSCEGEHNEMKPLCVPTIESLPSGRLTTLLQRLQDCIQSIREKIFGPRKTVRWKTGEPEDDRETIEAFRKNMTPEQLQAAGSDTQVSELDLDAVAAQ